MKTLPTKDELAGLLHEAVARFNDSNDRETLLRGHQPGLEQRVSPFRVAHEQAISYRLAFYLECLLRKKEIVTDKGPIIVDCEYNQHLFDHKKLRVLIGEAQPFLHAGRTAIPVPGSNEAVEFIVRPDVLVHMRGNDGPTNLLVLEIKRWTNAERQHDALKLRLFTELGLNKFGYVLGAAVYARNDRDINERELEVGLRFHGGKPC
ncbi:MAG: hypothetical protein HYY24_19545 [Verrucomicrobia bacterium]|nr:hypothetical protein [Verrucomicrobiota bacterium]